MEPPNKAGKGENEGMNLFTRTLRFALRRSGFLGPLGQGVPGTAGAVGSRGTSGLTAQKMPRRRTRGGGRRLWLDYFILLVLFVGTRP